MITDIRSYYGRNVVGRVLANPDGRTIAAHNYLEMPGAIPIPATLSLELGEVIGASRRATCRYRFVSDYVFASRPPHMLDAFETGCAADLPRRGRRSSPLITPVSGSLLRPPHPSRGAGGHGRRPASPATTPIPRARSGTGRSATSAASRRSRSSSRSRPISSPSSISWPISPAPACSASPSPRMQWRQARTFGRMNRELEEANSFLASVSMKISKYLSPQVYR